MKGKIWFVATTLMAVMAPAAGAQSVSGLSVKQAVSEEIRKDPKRLAEALKELEGRIHLAVPAGATAAVGDDETASAGPVFGFQAWRLDSFFAGAFFTFSPSHRLNGGQRTFGEFVRNPPAEGTSFYASGSRVFWRFGYWSRDIEPRPSVLMGGAFRVGVTNATFERTIDGEVVGKEAFVLHLTPSLQVLSRTFKDETSDNEYQFGIELGPTLRHIGGDAAQGDDFLKGDDVLGKGDKWLGGLEATVFVRLNAFQPFVRITHFGKRSGTHVAGLTGTQAFFGVNVASAIFQTSSERR